MAYDETLARRMREGIGATPGVTERKMMGGLCMFLDGNMLGSVGRAPDGHDRFMVRVGKDNEAGALARLGSSIVTMGGRRFGGFVYVAAEGCDDAALRDWFALARGFVAGLPTKR